MKYYPPPVSLDDVAFHVTAIHSEGGTWSAIERTPEDAQASMDRQLKSFPKTYRKVLPPMQCGVSQSGFGLVWKIVGVGTVSETGA